MSRARAGDRLAESERDLFAWAEGCGDPTRNGRPFDRAPWPTELRPEHPRASYLLGVANFTRFDLHAAMSYLQRAVAGFRAASDPRGLGSALVHLAITCGALAAFAGTSFLAGRLVPSDVDKSVANVWGIVFEQKGPKLFAPNSDRPRSDDATGFHGTGAETICQNSFSRSTRFSASLPAMMAALTAPIEMPAIHSGSKPLRHNA